MIHAPGTDIPHLITAISYFFVGGVLFWCGASIGFRYILLRNEAERALTFKLVAVFVYACFLDHLADALGAGNSALIGTAIFEAVVSAGTAVYLGAKAASRWRG